MVVLMQGEAMVEGRLYAYRDKRGPGNPLLKVKLLEKVGRKGKIRIRVYADALESYSGLSRDFAHATVDHAERYVEGHIHTNGIENFWSLLKRGLHGTYVSVEPFHLFRYLDERLFAFNRCALEDYDRFEAVLHAAAGRRLTYARLTGQR